MTRRLRLAWLMLSAAWLSACVGPAFRRPVAPAVQQFVPAAERSDPGPEVTPAARSTDEPPREWWHAFHSAALDRLVEAARRANPGLQAQQAAMREAVEYAKAQRAVFWPVIGATAGASRNRDAIQVVQGTLQSNAPVYTLYNAQAAVSFVPDLFGINRRLVESADAAADVASWERDASELTLAGNVVTAALQIAGLRAQIDALQSVLESQRELLAIQRRGERLGAVSGVEVLAQESAVATTAAALAPLKLQLEQTRHWLSVLTGRLPQDAWPEEDFSLERLTMPGAIPAGVPAHLVDRRPDVRAAEAALHVATAQAGVAAAALLPQIEFTGVIGSTASPPVALFHSGTGFWSGAASLSQVLFDAGAARHRRRAAYAALDAAGAQYRLAVLTAYQNVADGLRALNAAAESQAQSERAEQAARQARDIAQRQEERGAASGSAAIQARAAWLEAAAALAAARAQRLTAAAALLQALAGNAPDAASGAATTAVATRDAS